ncbi:protein SRC2 [Sesamum angolense]|uniref:Protein SRC2 n=1 Tax=Sesamum angolense TaxID=2727404 RepID=A0AAE1W7Z7_9LAMI|nr:protein SRC2 [Sesamum angolense]
MERRTLDITLRYAKDLKKLNLISTMDVYAIVSISGGCENSNQTTRTPADREGGRNPTWDFPMRFVVEETALQQNRLTLDVKLRCERFLGDKEIGEVHVPVKELLDGGAGGRKFVSYQVRKPSGRPKGQLTFSYKFSEEPNSSAAPPQPPVEKVFPEPVTAYPMGGGRSWPYPAKPPLVYPPLYPAVVEEVGRLYPPPPARYTQVGGLYPPLQEYAYPPAPSPQPGYGCSPPSPPPQRGYGYPLLPAPSSYAYPPLAVEESPRKNIVGRWLVDRRYDI